jgi:hypothetical protein
MSRRPQPPPKPVPVEEEEFDEEEDEEMDEYPDMFDALSSLLATDDGETVATALVSTKDAVERIATSLEMQNKILVKILSAMGKSAPPPAPASTPADEEA